MYEYEQKIWNGKKWEPTYSPVVRTIRQSEINNEKIVDFASLNWIECLNWCNDNIKYVEIKKTWRKNLKIKIYTGDIFSNKCITLTEKNYKKFKVGDIYTKIITTKDRQKKLINDFVENY